MEISIEDLARLFAQHMPHGQDIGMQMDAPSADGRTRMRLPPQPFLSGDASANFFFPGVLFSMADTACGMAVFRALGRYVPIATIDMRIDHLAPATMDADLVPATVTVSETLGGQSVFRTAFAIADLPSDCLADHCSFREQCRRS